MTDNQITTTTATVREGAGIEGLRFHDLSYEAIRTALEIAGVEFIPEKGGGGVNLRSE